MSALQYARHWGLAVKYEFVDPLPDLAAAHQHLSLESDEHLPGAGNIEIKESAELFEVSKKALKYLSDALGVPNFTSLDPDPYWRRRLMIELPLLRSDNELDVADFRLRTVTDPLAQSLALEKLDDDNDEWLMWPSSLENLPSTITARIETEKMSVSRHTLSYLAAAIKHVPDSGNTIEDFKLNPSFLNISKGSISPPLLPLSPDLVPFVPPSENGRSELLSEHTNSFGDELRQLNHELVAEPPNSKPKKPLEASSQAEEEPTFDPDSLDDEYSPLSNIKESPEHFLPRRRKDDAKIECPMTPPTPLTSGEPWTMKDVPFKEKLSGSIRTLPSPILCPDDTNNSTPSLDAPFIETIKPIAEKVSQRIEQESRKEEKTTCRVSVPSIDLARTDLPWKSTVGTVNMSDMDPKVKAELTSYGHWQIPSDLQRSLQWSPFPAELAKVSLDEDLFEDNILEEWITEPESEGHIGLAYELKGIRVLDDKESDDETVEGDDFSEAPELPYLLRKRKLDLITAVVNQKPTPNDQEDTTTKCILRNTDQISFFADTFSASCALEGFVGTDSRLKKQKMTSRTSTGSGDSQQNLPTSMTSNSRNTANDSAAHNESLSTKYQAAPENIWSQGCESKSRIPHNFVPDFASFPSSSPFIISTTMISQRKLLLQVRNFLPNAIFIERDFSSRQPRPSSVIIPGAIDSISHEADFLIAPGTGLIITTIQKLHQRPLPGQSLTKSQIQRRIATVAPRYNALIVLVSQNKPQDMLSSSLTASENNSLVYLSAFTRSPVFLGCDIDVQIIYASGDDEEVAAWIAFLVAKHSGLTANLHLIKEETTWELWLRRAGLNAFAAQVVLHELKAPDEVLSGFDTRVASEFGLPKFVHMSEQERVDKFRQLLGGEGLLRRVSKVVDASWGSP